MKQYKDWAPSQHDIKGLNLPEWQEAFVIAMTTRDSDRLEVHNWKFLCSEADRLGAEEEKDYGIFNFNHWACGWFDILLVRKESPAFARMQELIESLEDYPILDEDNFNWDDDEEDDEDDDDEWDDDGWEQAYDAGNYAGAYNGLSLSNSYVKWITEARLGYEKSKDWEPTQKEIRGFVRGYMTHMDEEDTNIDELVENCIDAFNAEETNGE